MKNFNWDAAPLAKPTPLKKPEAEKPAAQPLKQQQQDTANASKGWTTLLTRFRIQRETIVTAAIMIMAMAFIGTISLGIYIGTDTLMQHQKKIDGLVNATILVGSTVDSLNADVIKNKLRMDNVEAAVSRINSKQEELVSKTDSIRAESASGDSTATDSISALTSKITALESNLSTTLALIGNLSVTLFKKDRFVADGSVAQPEGALAKYANLQCYKDFRNQGWGKYFDPEWVCGAAMAGIPDYAGMAESACACAREAGVDI